MIHVRNSAEPVEGGGTDDAPAKIGKLVRGDAIPEVVIETGQRSAFRRPQHPFHQTLSARGIASDDRASKIKDVWGGTLPQRLRLTVRVGSVGGIGLDIGPVLRSRKHAI